MDEYFDVINKHFASRVRFVKMIMMLMLRLLLLHLSPMLLLILFL